MSEYPPTVQAGNDDSRATKTDKQPYESPSGLGRDEDLGHGV
jgi:hypothetical protein